MTQSRYKMATENDNFEVLVESAFEVEPGAKKENLLVGLVSEVEIAQEVLSRELQTCRLTTWKFFKRGTIVSRSLTCIHYI